MNSDEIREAALKYAILNAATHGGKAQNGPVLNKMLAEFSELRTRARELMTLVAEIVGEVNEWTNERQRIALRERWPELLEQRPVEEKKRVLPPLSNVGRFGEVRTRFAPNPDGALHLGSARPIVLCDEYAKMYRGKFVLRFEDTSPEVKAPIPEMYDWILEDLRWLGVEPDEVYYQSDRLEIYYRYAEMLLSMGTAYVCTCEPSEFKKLYLAETACPCRELPPDVQLSRWKNMLDGTYRKGDAVVRVKTDLSHPNPGIRDWPALRISTSRHPRVGGRYRVWPLYNFSCAVDDHEMVITHIIRGKEHEVNTIRQRYLFGHLGWEYPEIINVGRLGLEVGILSKSKIRAGVQNGTYWGWDDPRLGTLRALKRRGIQPDAIRKLMIEVGPKPINATLSWGNIASANKQIIEPIANRYFFVADPVPLRVFGVEGEQAARLPLHPDHPERGTRDYVIKPRGGEVSLLISRKDSSSFSPGKIVRLMGLLNVEIRETEEGHTDGSYHSKDHQRARTLEATFIHWLPEGEGIETTVVMPDGSTASGLAERACQSLGVGTMIQFERFGFVRIDHQKPFTAYFAHS